ncbi:MAG TPA: hypothetical protein VEJ39_03970 [Candidatus Acidoferrales bacterium]|nr:hypothetical protein [Candidatus Acidoferrales bacterium]
MAPEVSVVLASAFVAAIGLAVFRMRRMSLRGQFLALVALGVCAGLVLLTAIKVLGFPHWLAMLLVVMMIVASPIATRTFVRAMKQEGRRSARPTHDEARNLE